MSDFGISTHAPEFAKNCPEEAKQLVEYLKDEIGVPKQCSLKDITVEDLLESKLLKRGAANKLFRAWQKEESGSGTKKSLRSSGISINARRIGQVKNAEHDINEENIYYGRNDHRTIKGDKNNQTTTIESSTLENSTVANVKGDAKISYGTSSKRGSVGTAKKEVKQEAAKLKREAMQKKEAVLKRKRKYMDAETEPNQKTVYSSTFTSNSQTNNTTSFLKAFLFASLFVILVFLLSKF